VNSCSCTVDGTVKLTKRGRDDPGGGKSLHRSAGTRHLIPDAERTRSEHPVVNRSEQVAPTRKSPSTRPGTERRRRACAAGVNRRARSRALVAPRQPPPTPGRHSPACTVAYVRTGERSDAGTSLPLERGGRRGPGPRCWVCCQRDPPMALCGRAVTPETHRECLKAVLAGPAPVDGAGAVDPAVAPQRRDRVWPTDAMGNSGEATR